MRVAGVQCDIQFAMPDENLRRMISFLEQTSAAGAELTVFPECSLSGYCFDSIDAARAVAQTIPGPATEKLQQVCQQTKTNAVFGMIEKSGSDLFNAAVFVGPNGVMGVYRKVHLPYLGVDRFASFGDRGFSVYECGEAKIGPIICYDASFPEATRSLALQGADLIVLPTNWPPGAECVSECTIRTRASENSVYFIAVNRIGIEGGFPFIGRSQIVDPSGNVLHFAGADSEEVFYADIDLERARRKHIVRVPGEHEIDRFADRRPESYKKLVEPHFLDPPGREAKGR